MSFVAWKRPVAALLICTALAGCAMAEMKMAPAASPGVGVRFAQGEAFMVSAGDQGAIAVVPVRYNGDSQKVVFVVAGYNRSGTPINFGPENLSISLDNGAALPVYDFDSLQHGARVEANQQRAIATLEAAMGTYAAYHVGRRHPAEGRALMRDVADNYDDQMNSIGQNLVQRLRTAQQVLQTTTIDPGSYWAGWIIADQPPLAAGEVRRMTVGVTFAGETHHFALFLAPEGTPTPPQVSLPAVTRADGQTMLYDTQRTWLWNTPPVPVQRVQTTYVVSRF